jgi:hypothetical protein
MRSHTEIVKATGANVVAELTGCPPSTVYSWARRNSIPADHWLVLVAEGHCTAAELMSGRARAA